MKAKKAKRPRAWNSTLPASAPTLKRSAMKRGQGPKRGGKVKPVNSARRKREFARCYHSEERVAFVSMLPCVVCEASTPIPSPKRDNAHIANGGMGRKAGYQHIIPLCPLHHVEQHIKGAGTFALKYSINLREAAAATEAAWQRYLAYVHQQESTQ